MKLHWILLFTIFLSFLSKESIAQDSFTDINIEKVATNISKELENFRYLTVNDGFSRNSVFKLLQDQKGIMWFGLWDGLYNYDGNRLQHVLSYSKRAGSNQNITTMISDNQDRIWVGNSTGLLIWDDVHKKKILFNLKTKQGEEIKGLVNDIYKDRYNNLWIINQSKKIFLYNPEERELKELSHMTKDCPSQISRIYIDSSDNIWITTQGYGIFRLEGDLPTATNPIKQNRWSIKRDSIFNIFSNTSVGTIFKDSRKNFWIGTTQGIYQVTTSFKEDEKPRIYQYDNHPVNINQIKVNKFTEYDNHIFAATNQGLFTFDLQKSQATWNLPNYMEEHHLNDKSFTDICIDKEYGFWLSSFYGGVNYVHPTNTNFSLHSDLNKEIQGHVISAISEDKNGNIWMGVEDNGVCLWDRKDNTIKNFNNSTNFPYHPSFNNVQSLYADGDYVYVGMYKGGMDIVNINTFQPVKWDPEKNNPDKLPKSIYSFHKSSNNILYVGTIDGLYKFNTETHQINKVKEVTGKVNCIAEDEQGDLWICTVYKGFYWYSQNNDKWWHFKQDPKDSINIIGNSFSSILPLIPSIYIGTQGNGLWNFNKSKKTFTQVGGDTFKNAIIFKIMQNGETLWVTTNRGLFAYNITTQQANQFTVRDGLRSNQFKENSGIIASDGLFMFGGLNGFNCFRPAFLRNNDVLPEVILTDFYLFNRSADIHDKQCPLKQSITYTNHIELNQKHHSFGFKFSSSSFCDPSKNTFEYKLEPFDREWQRSHGKSQMANYTNLPAGDYVFHVRTSNGQGAWSKEKCVKLTIHPYWWLSWPMKTLYSLIFLIIISHFIMRYRNKKKKEMHLFRIEKEQEVYESKMKFFTCMVHEIRTPLTLILGPLNSAMKKKEKTVNDVLPDLQIIERNGRRLLSLVNQLMDFRKVEEKSYIVQKGVNNIKDLVLDTARDFKYYNIQKTVSFELDIPKESCWAQTDREAFIKILVNLLSNAMKFTKDKIKISLALDSQKKYWELSVEDNGNGIAKEEQSSIFDSFYQVHQDLPGDYVGTGIGLFVVRRLLLLQGGDIRVESESGKGAKFIASIQYADVPAGYEEKQQDEEEVSIEEKGKEHEVEVTGNNQKRLLIAEDNEEMRNYIGSLFKEHYKTDLVENGKEALQYTEKTSYDLIITDLMMPIMDGMTLCRTLKHQATTCHIPIIILTAKDDENSQMEGFDSEADMYVTKPFSAEILQSRVRSILKNREHLREKFYSEPETTNEVLLTNESDKEFLKNLDDLINQNLSDCNMPIDNLASAMALGRSVFYQKVKGLTGLTPNDYIRTYRLKKAVALFQKGETRVNEVCYRVGFSSPSYFTKRFTQQFNISPSDYLKNLKKED